MKLLIAEMRSGIMPATQYTAEESGI